MLRKLIIFLAVNWFSCGFCQTLEYSRGFATVAKNLPLVILNNHPRYFHVLRYNKLAHDFTVERRAKPSAEILNFTPLRLDSVNSKWFNYLNLDYLLFEHHDKLYFVFEKVLNSKKILYMKVVDTLGKASGFIKLTTIARESKFLDFDIQFELTNTNDLLIINTIKYYNYTVKKNVLLYDPEKRKMIWDKKLPIENSYTGYSSSFECNNKYDLYYFIIKSELLSFERKYINHAQTNVPVYMYDSLIVHYLSFNNNAFVRAGLPLTQFTRLNTFSLKSLDGGVFVQLQYSKKEIDNKEPESYFFSQKYSFDLAEVLFSKISQMNKSIKEKLTFYDGTDVACAADKDFSWLHSLYTPNDCYTVSERKEINFYKELLVWRTDLTTGETMNQYLIPRKLLSSGAWSRYSNIGDPATICINDRLYIFLLEAKSNYENDPNQFVYNKLEKKSSERSCNLVLFELKEAGILKKSLLHANAEFDYIPLKYQSSNQEDAVLYLNSGKQEKFAILKLNRF